MSTWLEALLGKLEHLFWCAKDWVVSIIWPWLSNGREWANLKHAVWVLGIHLEEGVNNALNAAKAWATPLLNALNAALGWLGNIVGSAIDWVNQKGTAVWNWIQTKSGQVWDWISTYADTVATWFETQADAVATWFETQADAVVTWMETKADQVWDWIQTKGDQVWDWILAKSDAASDWIDRYMSFYQALYEDYRNDLRAFLDAPVQFLLDRLVLSEIEHWLYNHFFATPRGKAQ